MACPPKDAIMPTIKARKQANGVTRYTAIVRMRRGGAIIHRESRTFAHRTAALSWATHREVALEDPATLVRERQGALTLAGLIRWYIAAFETISKWPRSKQTHLEFLERHALGKTNALNLTAAMLIDHVRSRRQAEICRLERHDNDAATRTLPRAWDQGSAFPRSAALSHQPSVRARLSDSRSRAVHAP